MAKKKKPLPEDLGPFCLVIGDCPDDADIVGPFDTWEEATGALEAFQRNPEYAEELGNLPQSPSRMQRPIFKSIEIATLISERNPEPEPRGPPE